MTAIESIEKSLCESCTLEPYGINSFLVHTGYTYHDGDELHIMLKIQNKSTILTDEGHTLMWLSYENFNMTPLRNDLYQKILTENNVKDESGRIMVVIDDEKNAPVYLQSIVQALLQIADLRYLNRQNVVSTFIEDVKSEMDKLDIDNIVSYNEKIKMNNGEYCEPTVLIKTKEPILLFAINTNDRAKETLITFLMLRENRMKYKTIAVIDDNMTITEKDRKRLINYADRPIMGLSDFNQIVKEYVSACSQ